MPRPTHGIRRRARRWSPAEASAVLAAMAESGLSRGEFAKREGIHPQRLKDWARKLAATPARPAFIEVAHRPSSPIEILLRSGVVLRVVDGVDVAELRRIVDALEAPPKC